VRQNNVYQAMIAQGQQVINQGQTSKAMVEELAKRIFSDSQKNGGDQGLKDLMARQQITFSPTTPSSDSTSTSSPAPDATPAAH